MLVIRVTYPDTGFFGLIRFGFGIGLGFYNSFIETFIWIQYPSKILSILIFTRIWSISIRIWSIYTDPVDRYPNLVNLLPDLVNL